MLVDTPLGIDHFRNRNEARQNLLNRDLAFMHPIVIGAIACGTPPVPRTQTLADLGLLPTVQHVSLHETMAFIERESMYGMRCGLVCLILLASPLITPGAKLWTLNPRLAKLAEQFGVAHRVAVH